MIKIGFLIGKVVENPDRKDELDILKVEYKIVYSWKILKKYEDLGYSKEAFNCVQLLSENKVLVQAIEKFRKEFGLPKKRCRFCER